eukprot:scaffold248605_cov22-Tisochrysis_lutea.AAC.1
MRGLGARGQGREAGSEWMNGGCAFEQCIKCKKIGCVHEVHEQWMHARTMGVCVNSILEGGPGQEWALKGREGMREGAKLFDQSRETDGG